MAETKNGVASERLDEYVVAQGRVALSNDEVILLLRREVYCACEKLAVYKRVKRITIRHEEFPKTTTRKIKRFELERLMAESLCRPG